MNDSQALTLRAFLAALTAADPLEADFIAKMNAIAQNLDQRVGELHGLVASSSNVPLQTAYKSARRWLSQMSAERKAGLDVLPDNTPEPRSIEIDNTSRDAAALEDRSQKLSDISKSDLQTKAKTVLSADDPKAEVWVTFPFFY